MFKLFKKKEVVRATPTMTKDKIDEMTIKAKERLGSSWCAAKNSSLKYRTGHSDILRSAQMTIELK